MKLSVNFTLHVANVRQGFQPLTSILFMVIYFKYPNVTQIPLNNCASLFWNKNIDWWTESVLSVNLAKRFNYQLLLKIIKFEVNFFK